MRTRRATSASALVTASRWSVARRRGHGLAPTALRRFAEGGSKTRGKGTTMSERTHVGACRTGAVPAAQRRRGDEGRSHRGLWWLMLALLTLAAVGVVLLLLAGDDEGARDGAQQPGAGGELAADGRRLLPVPRGGLEPLVGSQAQGHRVGVLSVNPQEGSWVGSSGRDRVYVEYGGDVGETETNFTPGSASAWT